MRTRPVYDVSALLARIGIGLVFIAHGWRKIEAGITATGRGFDDMGVPLPTAAAAYAAFVELLGGAALIAGFALPVTGALLFLDMAGAFVFVHADKGLFLVDGPQVRDGYELVLILGLASLLFAAGGGGRLTLDSWLAGRRKPADRTPRARKEEEEESVVDVLRQADEEEEVEPERETTKELPGARTATEIIEGEDRLVAGRHREPRERGRSTPDR